MRSSKSRSRNKNNRRPSGNIVNRVFDSSGPEGKVRGTPQQIIEKYNGLARDAQLTGDRVAIENFQQHAEHYTRMLGEAMREQNERRDTQEGQQGGHNQGGNPNAQGGGQGGGYAGSGNDSGDAVAEPQSADAGNQNHGGPDGAGRGPRSRNNRPERRDPAPVVEQSSQPEMPGLDLQGGSESNLVDTPEAKPARKPRAQRPRKPRVPKTEGAAADAPRPETPVSQDSE